MKDKVAKIADFGLSRIHQAEDSNVTNSNVGPLKWMAPECISKKQYSVKSDVWAFGITCIELFTRTIPYPNLEALEVCIAVSRDGLKPDIPENCPQSFQSILQQCFEFKQENRPDFDQILQNFKTK